jgi:hypothetical protein
MDTLKSILKVRTTGNFTSAQEGDFIKMNSETVQVVNRYVRRGRNGFVSLTVRYADQGEAIVYEKSLNTFSRPSSMDVLSYRTRQLSKKSN